MSDDLLAELTLIDLSQVQRAALLRWVPMLLTLGETEIAEEVRQAITAAPDMMKEAA